MDKNKMIIIGSGGHSRVIIDSAKNNNYLIKGIIDINSSYKGINNEKILGIPVIGNLDKINLLLDDNLSIFLAIGDNKLRNKIANLSILKNFNHIYLIDKNTIISNYSKINLGTYVAPGVIVNAEVKIGKFSIINTGSILEHEVSVGNYSHIGPGCKIAGRVKIGSYVNMGTGVCVKNNLSIGNNVIIGAGSVIINDIKSNSKVAGSPARDIR